MAFRDHFLIFAKWKMPGLYDAYRIKQHDDKILAKMDADIVTIIPPNATGRLGVAYDGKHFRDLDSLAVYTMIKNEHIDPLMMRIDKIERRLLAAGGHIPENITEQIAAQNVPQLPTRVPLRSLVITPSIRDLVLGISAVGTIRADMENLVHIAVGGSSGWGKSVFLQSIVYQLSQSIEQIGLILVDLEKVTFLPFYRCNRLLYPIVDDENETIGVFKEILSEMDRRKELYASYPGVDKLSLYNQISDKKLDPLVIAIDEGTTLMNDKRIEKILRTLAIRARKFGIWLIIGCQDWKVSSIDGTIKYQLSTQVQFKTKSGAQSRALLEDSCAKDIKVRGRAFAILRGQEMIEMQAPIIGYQDIIAAMTGDGPCNEMPETESGDLKSRVIEAWKSLSNPSITVVCRELFNGQQGGANWNRVKEIAYSTGLLDDKKINAFKE